ncbi:hypothetical protein GLYMA_08G094300v4 [Glycine max]|uniref:Uncharacterized protein n=1 Tax=Glycine max TaxID=3847 RepID=K7L5Q7_SOYBN|nr:hypothetical protein GYH30_020737 [Glycine max]KRH42521.1 hypothetical protein GLYMA_08G094300v4 [Glycine max]
MFRVQIIFYLPKRGNDLQTIILSVTYLAFLLGNWKLKLQLTKFGPSPKKQGP